jgi:hypothetical protein
VARKPADANNWPTFDAPLLQDVSAAFLRRRKALRYGAGLACEREFSEDAQGTHERLNLDLRRGHVRLSIWADGAMWFLVCQRGQGRNSGWAFKDTFHGDIHDVSAQALVGMVEATLKVQFGADATTERQQLREIWKRVRPYAG